MSTSAEQPVVTLSPVEMTIAANVAVFRQVTNLRDGRRDAHGATKERGWDSHIVGAMGELAVAKYFNVFWSGNLGNLSADDVGTLQVRATTWDAGRLPVHRTDPDDKIFILVVGTAPALRIAGWMYARDAKQEKWWDDPKGRPEGAAFFVPQLRLHPIASMPRNGEAPPPSAPTEAPQTEHLF